ncbi:MAG: rRNA maturation RNase YbeY [Alphaproteobacteria bacterium]|nr:rRNA maturation RNase YbeY [Alphaproteobacteria bacterium]
MTFSVLVEDDGWLKAVGADIEALVERVCRLTLERAPVLDVLLAGERASLSHSVVLTDDASIREMNKQFRTKDKATNVLSFPAYEDVAELKSALAMPLDAAMLEDTAYIGDMILARETIEREAKEQEKTFRDHFSHLLVHGTLHLLGYDHMTPEEEQEMESLEISILRELSIANPYE